MIRIILITVVTMLLLCSSAFAQEKATEDYCVLFTTDGAAMFIGYCQGLPEDKINEDTIGYIVEYLCEKGECTIISDPVTLKADLAALTFNRWLVEDYGNYDDFIVPCCGYDIYTGEFCYGYIFAWYAHDYNIPSREDN